MHNVGLRRAGSAGVGVRASQTERGAGEGLFSRSTERYVQGPLEYPELRQVLQHGRSPGRTLWLMARKQRLTQVRRSHATRILGIHQVFMSSSLWLRRAGTAWCVCTGLLTIKMYPSEHLMHFVRLRRAGTAWRVGTGLADRRDVS